jgi:hypothetical protein
LPLSKSDKTVFGILGILGFFLGALMALMTGSPEADQRFLTQLSMVNAELLAFSAVIFGVMYPALRPVIRDIETRLANWKRDLKNEPDMSEKQKKMVIERLPAKYLGDTRPLSIIIAEILPRLERLALEARRVYAQVFCWNAHHIRVSGACPRPRIGSPEGDGRDLSLCIIVRQFARLLLRVLSTNVWDWHVATHSA